MKYWKSHVSWPKWACFMLTVAQLGWCTVGQFRFSQPMARTGEGGEAGDGGGTDGPLQQSNRSRNSVDDSLSDLMVRMPGLKPPKKSLHFLVQKKHNQVHLLLRRIMTSDNVFLTKITVTLSFAFPLLLSQFNSLHTNQV